MAFRKQELDQLSGTVEEVVFANPDTGFAVVDLDAQGTLISAVGEMPGISQGEEVTLRGRFTQHPVYGEQFKVELCTRTLPSTSKAIEKYLAGGVIKGIGPKLARQLVEHFGDDTLLVMDQEPQRLLEIKGISQQKLDGFLEQFRQVFGVQSLLLLLTPYGVGSAQAVSLFKAYGEMAVTLLKKNPYLACDPRFGVPFPTCDAMAKAFGLPLDGKERLTAGLKYTLSHNLQNGHTALPKDRLVATAAKLLDQPLDTVEQALDAALEEEQLCRCDLGKETISLPEYFLAEQYIAARIAGMLRVELEPPRGLEQAVDAWEEAHGIRYEALQRRAILDCFSWGVLILTGGPGTGKTTTLNGMLDLLEEQGYALALCAPTGRAAKRMSEITHREAKTVHRLLEVDYDGELLSFRRNEKNPLKADVVVVDEVSMVDTLLMEALLRGIKPNGRLILVGDYNQLPSVGAGNVLWDLLQQQAIPTVRLTQVFRQAAKSRIITNAHAVVAGEMPDLSRQGAEDFFFLKQLNQPLAAQLVADLAARRLPRAYDLDAMEQVQVLCPQRKGTVGTAQLNTMLQNLLNPPDPSKGEFQSMGYLYRERDKVMQTKNNYNIPWKRGQEDGEGIFNGDIGIIRMIDPGSKTAAIDFDGRIAYYTFQMAAELELAYAITVHKSQGSEFDAVVMPILGGYDKLYYRNLLYTAMTRAKRLLVLVGDPGRLRFMVENNRKSVRFTNLGRLLGAYLES